MAEDSGSGNCWRRNGHGGSELSLVLLVSPSSVSHPPATQYSSCTATVKLVQKLKLLSTPLDLCVVLLMLVCVPHPSHCSDRAMDACFLNCVVQNCPGGASRVGRSQSTGRIYCSCIHVYPAVELLCCSCIQASAVPAACQCRLHAPQLDHLCCVASMLHGEIGLWLFRSGGHAQWLLNALLQHMKVVWMSGCVLDALATCKHC